MDQMYSKTIFSVAFALISLFIIASNSLLIYSLHRSKQLNNVSNRLILAMSVSDLCLGVFVLPVFAFNSVQRLESQAWMLTAAIFMSNVFVYTSFQIMICIAIDRYVHITKPSLYQSCMNESRLVVLIMCCVAIASGLATANMLIVSFWLFLAIAICNTFAVSGSIVLYTIIYKMLRIHQINKTVRLQQTNNNHNNSNNGGVHDGDSPTGQLSAIRTIRWVLVAFFLCYEPNIIISTVWSFDEFQLQLQQRGILQMLFASTTLLVFSTSGMNSVIIIFGNSRCRRAITSMFRKMVVAAA